MKFFVSSYNANTFESNLKSIVEKKGIDLKIISKIPKVQEIGTKFGVVRQPYFEYDISTPIERIQIDGFSYVGASIREKNSDAVLIVVNDSKWFEHIKENSEFKFSCFHCNSVRNRRKRFFFLNKDKNQIESIGSKCAIEYFGIEIGDALLKNAKVVAKLTEETELLERIYVAKLSSHKQYMSWIIKWFKAGNGYISKAKSEQKDIPASAQLIGSLITVNLTYQTPEYLEYREELRKTCTFEEIEEISEKIYKFYEDFPEDSEFNYNLKQQFTNHGETLGFLVYGVFRYLKEMDEIKRKEESPSKFFEGTEVLGEEVVCTKIRVMDGDYGEYRLITLRNDKYEFIVWSSSTKLQAEVNTKYFIKKGKVKKREEYNGTKQTTISIRWNNLEALEESQE